MNKAAAFAKLDLLTIRQYLTFKQLGLYLLVIGFVSFTVQNAYFVVGMLMMFGLMYSAYPFAIGDQSHTDLLYASLPLRKRDIVVGRYLFAVMLTLFAGVFSIALTLLLSTLFRLEMEIQPALTTLVILLLFYLLILSIQFPIYFKLGYTKARVVTILPIILIPFAAIAISQFLNKDIWIPRLESAILWVSGHLLVTTLLILVLCACILAVSAAIAYRIYKRRDF